MNRKVLMIIIIVILLCMLGIGGYMYYSSKNNEPKPEQNEYTGNVTYRDLDPEEDAAAIEYLESAHDSSNFPDGKLGVGEDGN